jgi:hypothetical protein
VEHAERASEDMGGVDCAVNCNQVERATPTLNDLSGATLRPNDLHDGADHLDSYHVVLLRLGWSMM